MRIKTTLCLILTVCLALFSCGKNGEQNQQTRQEQGNSVQNSEPRTEDQNLRSCLGSNYPDAVLFKKDYLKLINPQTAEYEMKHAGNLYDIEIDLDRDGFQERAVTGLLSLKPEMETETKYKGFVAILKTTAGQCQTVFIQPMDTSEISNMNLIRKEQYLMVAFAANTGYSILIEYKNGKYQIVEENDESDDEALPDELKTHSLN